MEARLKVYLMTSCDFWNTFLSILCQWNRGVLDRPVLCVAINLQNIAFNCLFEVVRIENKLLIVICKCSSIREGIVDLSAIQTNFREFIRPVNQIMYIHLDSRFLERKDGMCPYLFAFPLSQIREVDR